LIDIQNFFFLHFPVNITYAFLNNKLFHIFQMNVNLGRMYDVNQTLLLWFFKCADFYTVSDDDNPLVSTEMISS